MPELKEKRIIITRPLPGDPLARFRTAGLTNIWINPEDGRLERSNLLEAIRGAHAVLATPADVLIDSEFFAAAGEQLVIVSNYAVGVDNINLDEAARLGVLVGHTPHAVTEPTADIAWLLLLGAAKRAWEGLQLVHSGDWRGVGPNELLGLRLAGKTLFIVGPGRIGLATARRAPGFNMPVIYHARHRHPAVEESPINARRVSLAEGLRTADFISIHVPMSEETHHLIGSPELALMKNTAILVNTTRGPVVDEAALTSALRERRIYAAGLDVYENEPQIAPGLADLPHTFLLPHLGTATVEDRTWMMEIAVDNVIAALRGAPLRHEYPVNIHS